jgi:hypothetical protein
VTTLESTSERLEEALRRLAVEAADLFEELLASGAEMPFEIEPSDDSSLPMYSYTPLTGDFINRHMAELRRLEAFVEVRELASEEAAIGFMVGLWQGKTDFEIAGDPLEGAIDAVLSTAGPSEAETTPAGEVIVPLVGFHMPADEIELDGVRIVRADSISDAPVDAIDAVRGPRGRTGFLAQVSTGVAAVAPAAAVADDLRRALRTMRLFRPGAVGLAAHGWARHPGGWERFDTGVTRPRHGGYRLTGNEAAELENFARTLTERGARLPALDWAAARFDLGAERSSLIEALSDYLLALRGLLEGGGPANLGLSARVAALTGEGADEREAARRSVERALRIERKLMSGARFRPSRDASPLATIAEVEELLRRLLNGLATGALEGDLRAKADEVLLAQGMQAADAAVEPGAGETAEWRLPDSDDDDELILGEVVAASGDEISISASGTADTSAIPKPEEGEQPTRIVVDHVELPDIMGTDETRSGEASERERHPARAEVFTPEPEPGTDWFAAGDVEWPAFASPRREREEEDRPGASDRVRYLFPVPDSTDWDVGELRYERKQR